MIYEITGQPGHGKTLYGLHLAREFVRAGRSVYAHGVRDLDYKSTGFLPLEEPELWERLPDNSVVLIDECYSTFPNRNAASKVPGFIEALARHRHRGFDFILIHQQPNQVDPFVRGLVDTHYHVRRKFGFRAAVIKTWDYSTSNPIKDKPLRSPGWRYDKSLYSLYTSATMHTVKRTIPWQMVVAVPILGFVLWVGYRLIGGDVFASDAPPAAAPAAVVDDPALSGQVPIGEPVRESIDGPGEWLDRFIPRVLEYPMSAPAWDAELRVVSEPRIACMIGERVGCLCVTEQGTRYKIDLDKCVEIVEAGGVYNPFKEPVHDFARQQSARGTLADEPLTATE